MQICNCLLMLFLLSIHHFIGPRKSFAETERKALEQKKVYQQFKDLESRGEFAAANSCLESEVKKHTASDPDSTTVTIETGAYEK